jgi:hypothetical protein
MKKELVLRTLLAVAVSVGGCQQQSRAGAQSSGGSQDTVKIAALTPGTDAPLRVGDKVTFRVEAAYTLASANAGSITLVIQRGESGHPPLANETQVVEKGSGTVVLMKEVEIPDTAALQLFTPLSVQGSRNTSVVDSRVYKVTKG